MIRNLCLGASLGLFAALALLVLLRAARAGLSLGDLFDHLAPAATSLISAFVSESGRIGLALILLAASLLYTASILRPSTVKP